MIRVWALPAVLGSYAIVGWLYGLRDARLPLLILFVTNGINIVLSLLFVIGFGWGVPGVALASLIAEYTGFAAALLCAYRVLRGLPDDGRRSRVLDPARFARMLAINGDIVLRTFCVVSVLALSLILILGKLDLPSVEPLAQSTFFVIIGALLCGMGRRSPRPTASAAASAS